MVAEYLALPEPVPLPLLLEPLAPHPQARYAMGWRLRTESKWRKGWAVVKRVERDHAHDQAGALAQHVIVRYLVHGVNRAQLCRETGYAERQIQAYIQGRGYAPYTMAVLGALRELGITPHRGARSVHGVNRTAEIVAAQTRLLEQALVAIGRSTDPALAPLIARMRLLLAGREPLDGRGAS
jgi:hypothetical protein